jgi:hypothetical protein
MKYISILITAALLLCVTGCGSNIDDSSYTQVTAAPRTTADITTAGEPTVPTEPTESTVPTEPTVPTVPTEPTAASLPVSGEYDRAFYENTLFVGDSIFTGIDGFDFLPSRNVFAKVGISAHAIATAEITGRTLYPTAQQFNRVVIMIGTNGLSGTDAIPGVISAIEGIISAIKSNRADTQVIFLTLPPIAAVNDYPALSNSVFNEFNTAIKASGGVNGFTVIDFNSHLKNEHGFLASEFDGGDGVHLRGAAYEVMLSLIQATLQA